MSPATEYLRRVAACDALVTHWDGRPFAWGQADCTILAAVAVWFVTGREVMKDWPAYSDQAGALKALKAQGFESLPKAVDAFTAGRWPAGGMALPGDVLALPSQHRRLPTLGAALTDGRAIWSLDGRFVVGTLPATEPRLMAWRVV